MEPIVSYQLSRGNSFFFFFFFNAANEQARAQNRQFPQSRREMIVLDVDIIMRKGYPNSLQLVKALCGPLVLSLGLGCRYSSTLKSGAIQTNVGYLVGNHRPHC